jgi:hypothetical protein
MGEADLPVMKCQNSDIKMGEHKGLETNIKVHTLGDSSVHCILKDTAE